MSKTIDIHTHLCPGNPDEAFTKSETSQTLESRIGELLADDPEAKHLCHAYAHHKVPLDHRIKRTEFSLVGGGTATFVEVMK